MGLRKTDRAGFRFYLFHRVPRASPHLLTVLTSLWMSCWLAVSAPILPVCCNKSELSECHLSAIPYQEHWIPPIDITILRTFCFIFINILIVHINGVMWIFLYMYLACVDYIQPFFLHLPHPPYQSLAITVLLLGLPFLAFTCKKPCGTFLSVSE
jgi:hypothetical protein